MKTKPVWVLDTNVVLDWLVFNDARAAPLVQSIEAGQVSLVTRTDCRDEFIRVLEYPALKTDVAQRTQALLVYDRWHRPIAEQASDHSSPAVLPLCSDADDQKFMELALAANANWLITKDKALLKLARPVRQLGRFEILDVAQAVTEMQKPLS